MLNKILSSVQQPDSALQQSADRVYSLAFAQRVLAQSSPLEFSTGLEPFFKEMGFYEAPGTLKNFEYTVDYSSIPASMVQRVETEAYLIQREHPQKPEKTLVALQRARPEHLSNIDGLYEGLERRDLLALKTVLNEESFRLGLPQDSTYTVFTSEAIEFFTAGVLSSEPEHLWFTIFQEKETEKNRYFIFMDSRTKTHEMTKENFYQFFGTVPNLAGVKTAFIALEEKQTLSQELHSSIPQNAAAFPPSFKI